jgi:hypothetical protein
VKGAGGKHAYRDLVRKPVGKRPVGRSRCRLEGNIKMDRKEMEWEGMGESGSGPSGSIKCGVFLDWLKKS